MEAFISQQQDAFRLLEEAQEVFSVDILMRLIRVGANSRINSMAEAQNLFWLLEKDPVWMLKINLLLERPVFYLTDTEDSNEIRILQYWQDDGNCMEIYRYQKNHPVKRSSKRRSSTTRQITNVQQQLHQQQHQHHQHHQQHQQTNPPSSNDYQYPPLQDNDIDIVSQLYPFFRAEAFVSAPSKHIIFCNKAQTPSSADFSFANVSSENRMGQFAVSKGSWDLNQYLGTQQTYCIGLFTGIGQRQDAKYAHVIRFFRAGALDDLPDIVQERVGIMLSERRAEWPKMKKKHLLEIYQELWKNATIDLTRRQLQARDQG